MRRTRSKPINQKQRDKDDHDDTDDTDTAVPVTVTVTAETTAQTAEKQDDKDDEQDETKRHVLPPLPRLGLFELRLLGAPSEFRIAISDVSAQQSVTMLRQTGQRS
jgi:hypothetical protein